MHTEKQFEAAADWLIEKIAIVSGPFPKFNPAALFSLDYKKPELTEEEKEANKQHKDKCLTGFKKDIINYFRQRSQANPEGTISIDCDYHIRTKAINDICDKNQVALSSGFGSFYSISITADGKVSATRGKYPKTELVYDENAAEQASVPSPTNIIPQYQK